MSLNFDVWNLNASNVSFSNKHCCTRSSTVLPSKKENVYFFENGSIYWLFKVNVTVQWEHVFVQVNLLSERDVEVEKEHNVFGG